MVPRKDADLGTLPLRDELAIDRTLLANERTLLSYLRFGVALALAGVTIIHFVHHGWFSAIGIACLPAGALCGIIGTARYVKVRRVLLALRAKAVTNPAALGDLDA
jgi:putative membrane protein